MIRFLLILSLVLFQQPEPIKAISYNIRYNPEDGLNVWENAGDCRFFIEGREC